MTESLDTPIVAEDYIHRIGRTGRAGQKGEAIIAVTIPEVPGSFKAFCQAVGKRQITEFNYRYHTVPTGCCGSAPMT